MGYGFYMLPDGREAGYGVEADCDHDGCAERIDRGLGYLCGRAPDGHRDPDQPGCGLYFCGEHQATHDCQNPPCDLYEDGGDGCCTLAKDHGLPHLDSTTNHEFNDVELPDAMVVTHD